MAQAVFGGELPRVFQSELGERMFMGPLPTAPTAEQSFARRGVPKRRDCVKTLPLTEAG